MVGFYTKTNVCYINETVESILQQSRSKILQSLDEFESKGNLRISACNVTNKPIVASFKQLCERQTDYLINLQDLGGYFNIGTE